MTQVIWGARISLLVGLAATVLAMLIGSVVGHHAGLLRRVDRVGAHAPDRVVPRDPVPAAGDRAGRDPRALDPEHHSGHRHHVVAVPGPPDPRAGADDEGAPLRRSQPRARRLGVAPDDPPHPAQRLRADHRQHDADRAGRDPLRDDAVLPRARRPVARVVGQDAAGELRGRRPDPAGVVVLRAAGRRDSARRARLHAVRAGARGGPRSAAAGPARHDRRSRARRCPAAAVRDLHVTYGVRAGRDPGRARGRLRPRRRRDARPRRRVGLRQVVAGGRAAAAAPARDAGRRARSCSTARTC